MVGREDAGERVGGHMELVGRSVGLERDPVDVGVERARCLTGEDSSVSAPSQWAIRDRTRRRR